MSLSPDPSSPTFEQPLDTSAWRWRLEDANGRELQTPLGGAGATDSAPRFASQGDAESWIGEVWRQLVQEGVEAVTLFEADRQVYGPMSLQV